MSRQRIFGCGSGCGSGTGSGSSSGSGTGVCYCYGLCMNVVASLNNKTVEGQGRCSACVVGCSVGGVLCRCCNQMRLYIILDYYVCMI